MARERLLQRLQPRAVSLEMLLQRGRAFDWQRDVLMQRMLLRGELGRTSARPKADRQHLRSAHDV